MITTQDLDQFRADYRAGRLTLQDHRDFYGRIAAEYPDQSYFDLPLAVEFFGGAKPKTVCELGGWDGTLALKMLNIHPEIEDWCNYEIAPVSMPWSKRDSRYRQIGYCWMWEGAQTADAFVASHSLEHLTEEDFRKLLAGLYCRYAYVDVPLLDVPYDWNGSTTTHVLGLSIQQFDDAWLNAGWRIMQKHHLRGAIPSNVRFLEQYVV